MATLCCFHAHPDDEAIATGGTMRAAADAGHRVILVVATRGEHGEPVPGVLGPDEQLWERRVRETHAAAEILGASRVEFLGYVDSGMMGEPTNHADGSFWAADVDEAAERLAAILRDESVDVLTVYDEHGGYGHPDHIQVNRVGTRAAELAGVERVYWATMNRTRILAQMAENPDMRGEIDPDDDPMDMNTFGMPEDDITHAVDVSAHVATKRAAMAAHASQIAPDAFFLAMPDDVFAGAFGTEWFVDPTRPRAGGAFGADLFS
ncbi:MAG: PIG-L family deacetylase [Acidimicrobiales bacterium]